MSRCNFTIVLKVFFIFLKDIYGDMSCARHISKNSFQASPPVEDSGTLELPAMHP